MHLKQFFLSLGLVSSHFRNIDLFTSLQVHHFIVTENNQASAGMSSVPIIQSVHGS